MPFLSQVLHPTGGDGMGFRASLVLEGAKGTVDAAFKA